MISPNVWTLDSPKSAISYKYDKLTEDNENKLIKKINSHYFNNILSIALPDTNTAPNELSTILANSDHYIVKDVSAKEFIDRQFIEGFIKRGAFYGLSHNTRIDIDDCIAITPCGRLHLVLHKELYQSLGLEGQLSQFAKKSKDRYTLEINLLNPDLVKSSKYRDRILLALSHELLPRCSVRLYWEPEDDSICTSSIGKYFSDKGYDVELCETNHEWHNEYTLNMPEIGQQEIVGKNENDPEVFCSPHELVEYLGMLTLACKLDEKERYLSSYCVTGKTTPIGQARIMQWRGLFACSKIVEILPILKKYISERPHVPWVSLYCQGYANSPVSYGRAEHQFGVNGNNAYVIFITSGGHSLWYQILESNKMLK